jgi:hypothetical protein
VEENDKTVYSIEPRYLELANLELPAVISNWKLFPLVLLIQFYIFLLGYSEHPAIRKIFCFPLTEIYPVISNSNEDVDW